MQMRSSLPGPLLIELDTDAPVSFTVQLGSEPLELAAQLCDLAVLGLVLGAAPGDGVITEEGTHGTLAADARTAGAWALTGVHAATVLTPDGVTTVSATQLGAWAALGVLRALADAPAPR